MTQAAEAWDSLEELEARFEAEQAEPDPLDVAAVRRELAKQGKRLRAAIYVRISLDRAGAGLGVGRQEDDCRALAKRIKVDVVGVYVDNDVEASSGKPRPEYMRLLADLVAGLIDVILVWHTDRLHRRPIELEEFINIVEKRPGGVPVYPVKAGKLDLATPAGRMVARQLAAVAKYEVEMKGERQKSANLQAAKAGRPKRGRRVFGFEADAVTHRPAEARALRQAAKAILAGTALNKIAKDWNAAGLLTATGGTWSAPTVRQTLVRESNAGLRVYQGKVISRGTWKPIIPEDQWRAVVAKLDDPARKTGPGNKPRWLLSGIAQCGAEGCDCTVRLGTTSGARRDASTRAIYRCRASGPGHVARAAVAVDEFVTEVVVRRLSRDDARDLLRTDEEDDSLDELMTQADVLRVRLDELTQLFMAGSVTKSQLATGTAVATGQLAQVEARIAARSSTTVFDGLIGVKDTRAAWENLDISRQRAVVDALMTVVILPLGRGSAFRPELIRIDWRG